MAVPAGSLQTYTAIGNREDLENAIYNISPTETPFLSMAKRVSASATAHEWQRDSLATALTSNAQIEGDDASNGTSTPTTRLKNFTQISSKYAVVSGTQNAVNSAGRKREMAYQLMKRSQEIKRDMESILTQEHGSSAGGTGTARQLAAAEAWLSANKTSLGTGTAQTTPGFVTATGLVTTPTDSTAAGTFVVSALKAVIREAWTQGGDPKVIMVGGFNKTQISGFTGIATLYREAGLTAQGTRIIGAADVYVSDFGEHRIVPNRFQRDKTCLILDMDYWSVAYLRRFEQLEIARTGDSEKRQIISEYTLVCRNELASGKVTDLTTS
ncbi:MAG TPA: DUF5309 domain-containing protein [Nitrospiraceae bacterium]|nr:DUF5309 domain-containing protein [Nitrospiraceae bacterium]